MNKIPQILKRIVIRFGFHTLMCERGHLHGDKVKFDQVKNSGIGCGGHFDRQRSMNGKRVIWWRKP